MDKILGLGLEGREFGPSHHRSISPLGSLQLTAARFLNMIYPVITLIKKVKDERLKRVENGNLMVSGVQETRSVIRVE